MAKRSARHDRYLADVIRRVHRMNGDVSRIDPRRVDRSLNLGRQAGEAAALELRRQVDEARRERATRNR